MRQWRIRRRGTCHSGTNHCSFLCIGCIVVFSIFTVLTCLEAATGLYRSGRLITSELNIILSTYDDQSTTPKVSLLPPITTPVEEDTSCLARTQHLLYRRNPEKFAPSPEYENMWSRPVHSEAQDLHTLEELDTCVSVWERQARWLQPTWSC